MSGLAIQDKTQESGLWFDPAVFPIATSGTRGMLPPIAAATSVLGGLEIGANGINASAATTTVAGALLAADKAWIDKLAAPYYLRYYRSAAHGTIANNTLGPILYDTKDYERGVAWSVNTGTGVFTLQTGFAGLWEISGRIRWTAVAGNNYFSGRLYKGATLVELDEKHGSNANEISNCATAWAIPLVAGDTITMQAVQITGGALAPLNTQSGTAITFRWCGG